MKKLSTWFCGQIKIQLTGFGKDRILKLCQNNDIHLYNLVKINDGYVFLIDYSKYKLLISFNNKIKADIKVLDKIGLPFFFIKHKKRKVFLLGLIISILCVYYCSNYIWKITITGNETYTNEEIIEEISKNYVKIGTKKSKVNCNELETKLRKQYDNIAWISCQIKGTNLYIDLKETIPQTTIITTKEPCNIVAYKDAVVTDIVTSNGTKVINQGDSVKKNDILISGVVNIKNEYDELIETNYTNASGTIYGIVEYNYEDSFDMEQSVKEYTNNTKKSYQIYAGDKYINLSKKANYSHYDIYSESKQIKLFQNIYLPLGYTEYIYKEYKVKNTVLTRDEAKQIAEKKLVNYIDNLKKKGVSILENNVTISIEGNKCLMSGKIICKEIIGVPSLIEIIPKGD